MKITKIWFDASYIYGKDEKGRESISNLYSGILNCKQHLLRNECNTLLAWMVFIGVA